MPYPWILGCAALVGASIAAYTDWRTGLIANRLTLGALAIGLLLALISNGPMGLGFALAGALVAALVPLGLFRVGAMGGGDVKLFAALGALLGVPAALEVQGLAFGIGAVQGIALWIARGQLRAGLWSTATVLLPGRRSGQVDSRGMAATPTEIRFAPAIALATWIVVGLRLGGLI